MCFVTIQAMVNEELADYTGEVLKTRVDPEYVLPSEAGGSFRHVRGLVRPARYTGLPSLERRQFQDDPPPR